MNSRQDNVFINKKLYKIDNAIKISFNLFIVFNKKNGRKTKISIYNSVKSCHKMFIVSASPRLYT